MTVEEVSIILNVGLKLIGFGYFTYGLFCNKTYGMAAAAVFFLMAQQ